MTIKIEQKYLKSFDGTQIGYQIIGKGPNPFVLCSGLGGNHLAWSPLYNHFKDQFTFITWDYRGLFTSEIPANLNTLDVPTQCQDLERILKKEKISKAIFGGWSMGVQVCLEHMRKNKRQVKALCLLNGTSGCILDTALNSRLSKYVIPHVNQLLIKSMPFLQPRLQPIAKKVINSKDFINIAAKLGLIHHNLDSKIFKEIAHDMIQTDLKTYHQILEKLAQHDASDVLAHIKCPTLIVASTEDLMTPPQEAERMAQKIDNAQLFVVNHGSHYCLLEFPEMINKRIEQFLNEFK